MTTHLHSNELRAAYLHTFDNFAVHPGDLVSELEDLIPNQRYARELLNTLAHAGLVAQDWVNGEDEVWQVANPGTPDSASRTEAEATIDGWLAAFNPEAQEEAKMSSNTQQATRPAKNDNPAELPTCKCGCGTPVSSRKSLYRPGHDARHAGNVARAIAKTGDFGLLDELPSGALKAKAQGMADRLIAKINPNKGPREVSGVVKAGRYEFPARQIDGKVQRRENRDGTGEWQDVSDRVAATFKSDEAEEHVA